MSLLTGMAKFVLSTFLVVAAATLAWAQPAPISDVRVAVGKQMFRYLSAGSPDSKAIVLLHGWPQSADEFRDIIPKLAEHYAVYAPDLPGIGGTTAPAQNWDKAALAHDIKIFVDRLGLERPLIVGHDIGGMVAYAYARQYAADISGVAILDVPIPGLAPWDDVAISPHAWHFDFHKQEGLAETLVTGRQAEYFRYFIDKVAAKPTSISDDELQVYASAYGSPDSLHAGFEFYRAFENDAVFFEKKSGPFDIPMLVLGGEFSMAAALPVMEGSFSRQGVANIQSVAIAGAGHWLSEEQPAATASAINAFAKSVFDK